MFSSSLKLTTKLNKNNLNTTVVGLYSKNKKTNLNGNKNDHVVICLNDQQTRNLASTANAASVNSTNSPNFGFLFDIDGVLVRGKTLLPRTRDCVRLLTDKNGNFKVPTIFLTNAGNELRSSKSAKLSNLLGVYVKPDQVVMSHSPLRMLKSFHSKRCLISGQGPIVDIAKNLGFKSVITIDDLRQYYPHLDVVDHKRRTFAPCVLGRYFPPIEAIILFGESIRWETNLQLLIDVLMCNGKLDQPAPTKFPEQNLPILACNTDMVWMAEASMPRFGHGTFLHCLEQIYKKLSNKELKYSAVVGKPSEITYHYAENMIQKHAESIGVKNKIKRLYAVGDNLDTDIYGANVYNQILENNRRQREKLCMKQQKSKNVLLRNEMKGVVSVGGARREISGLADMLNTEENQEQMQRAEYSDQISQQHDTESISSILVRTGVFQGDINDLNNFNVDSVLAHKDMIIDPALIKPNYISDNVYEAVKLVYQLESFNNNND